MGGRRVDRTEHAARIARSDGLPVDRVIGTAEVAALLGLSRGRAAELSRTDRTFPRPVYHRFWYRAGIEVWAALHRPGKPPTKSPFRSAIAPLVEGSAEESRAAGCGPVVGEFLWPAFWRAGSSGEVARVLASLGVTAAEARVAARKCFARNVRRNLPETMSPRFQSQLERALVRARRRGDAEVREIDIACVLVEDELEGIANAKRPSRKHWFGRRAGDGVLIALGDRGLDAQELMNRLEAVQANPEARSAFEQRTLGRLRRRRERGRPPWLRDLMPNPLGHDPWDRQGWGSVFFLTPAGRQYKVDGYQWFFHIDGDGYPVRTADGRPVGYRWRILPLPPATESEMDFEILPMPPDPVSNWPDQHYGEH